MFYRPGVIIGGKIHHDCPVSRSIGYFLEPLIGLAPFAKVPFQITMTGVTNDNVDVSVCFFFRICSDCCTESNNDQVDTIRTVLLPQLKRVGIEGDLQLKVFNCDKFGHFITSETKSVMTDIEAWCSTTRRR